jgi:hypothetical protein
MAYDPTNASTLGPASGLFPQDMTPQMSDEYMQQLAALAGKQLAPDWAHRVMATNDSD